MSGMLKDKNIVIMGVANKWSIAWGIAEMCLSQGANLIFTYYGDRSLKSLKKLLSDAGIPEALCVSCDVTNDEDITSAFKSIADEVSEIHGVAHCIAHANKDELRGLYMDTSREGFKMAHDISAYSLVAVTKAATAYMSDGGSIITLSYLGGERVVLNYNVMGVAKAALESSVKYLAHDLGPKGIRVNAISAGPIKTLAAKGVGEFNEIGRHFLEKAPLQRLVTQKEVGNAAVFFLSDMGSAVTGETMHVDCGFNILGY
jgi:enoyl-[acyl-carrier protein] reductase I